MQLLTGYIFYRKQVCFLYTDVTVFITITFQNFFKHLIVNIFVNLLRLNKLMFSRKLLYLSDFTLA